MGVVGIYLYATASTTPALLQVSSMHQLLSLPNTQAPTMSSREIAALCNKRHDNVMADIRKMFAELDMNAPEFSGTFTTEQGNTYECFNLPKRECLILVSSGGRPSTEYYITFSQNNEKGRPSQEYLI